MDKYLWIKICLKYLLIIFILVVEIIVILVIESKMSQFQS